MAQPQYKLSAPNTGSYQLAPQASPVSVYTRPEQLDPKYETSQNQIKAFQSFVKDLADWRQAENKDNREQAKLRALADDARGELDANLEAEDEDYQKYGRFLQGKNYSKEIGSRLVTEITVGSEGKPGLMDQAFAEAKKAENANRKVEDIFSELLEERKDHYRSQVPDSSDEFYSGFGEGFQPFANEINKAFYERVQKETYSDRRENFSQGLRDQVEKDIRLIKDEAEGSENIIFNQAYLREFAADNGVAAGLSEDAALGEAIRIWSQELEEIIINADSEEDLEIADNMLAVFHTDIKSKNGVKGRARLVDIPIFAQEAGQNYVSLGKAIETKRDEIEREEEKERKEKAREQDRALFTYIVSNDGAMPDISTLNSEAYSEVSSERLVALTNFSNKWKDRSKKVTSDPVAYTGALVRSKNGTITEEQATQLRLDGKITDSQFNTIIGNIISGRKIDKDVIKFAQKEIVMNELTDLSMQLKSKIDGISMFERSQPENYQKWALSLGNLSLKVAAEADKILKTNTQELTKERQLEIVREAVTKLGPDIEKHNKLVAGFNSGPMTSEDISTDVSNEDTVRPPLTIKLSEKSSVELNDYQQRRYITDDDSWEDLYEDYYEFVLNIRGAENKLDPEFNIFYGKTKAEGKRLFAELQDKMFKNKPPKFEDGTIIYFNSWAQKLIYDELKSPVPMREAYKDALKALYKVVSPKGTAVPKTSGETFLDNLLNPESWLKSEDDDNS